MRADAFDDVSVIDERDHVHSCLALSAASTGRCNTSVKLLCRRPIDHPSTSPLQANKVRHWCRDLMRHWVFLLQAWQHQVQMSTQWGSIQLNRLRKCLHDKIVKLPKNSGRTYDGLDA